MGLRKTIGGSAKFHWGHGSITGGDWGFLRGVIRRYGVRDVVEFGCGLSTVLFDGLGLRVVSYETKAVWVRCVGERLKHGEVRLWDGEGLLDCHSYDLAFVDGPAGGDNRGPSTFYASLLSDVVVCHDGERDRKWAEAYLGNFELVRVQGGCYEYRRVRKEAA